MRPLENLSLTNIQSLSTEEIKSQKALAETYYSYFEAGDVKNIKKVVGTLEDEEYTQALEWISTFKFKCEEILKERGVIEKNELDLLFT